MHACVVVVIVVVVVVRVLLIGVLCERIMISLKREKERDVR